MEGASPAMSDVRADRGRKRSAGWLVNCCRADGVIGVSSFSARSFGSLLRPYRNGSSIPSGCLIDDHCSMRGRKR
jgi:hypothetical protein